jgi:hypothetical protein
MKIIVEFYEIKETADNAGTVGSKNKLLNEKAFQFQNYKTDILKLYEPKNLEVIISLFFDETGSIKWAFKNPEQLTEQVKDAVRDVLNK